MLQIEALACAYGTAQVLNGVNLSIASGETVALLGRNGMGKTSLVRCLLGMRPPAITAGRILFDGVDLTRLPSYAIAQHGLALVPQGRRVFPSLTVRENLTVVESKSGGWTAEQVYELFPQLQARSRAFGSALSGGEQQMLAIGRALVTNPRLLVMDEASEGLAPIVLGEIRRRLEVLKSRGLTTLIVEQNVGLALALADRIDVLGSHGAIVWSGTADEFRNAPEMQHRHLGV